MLYNRIEQFLSKQKTLEEKFFWCVVLFSIFSAVIATLFTIYENIGWPPVIMSLVCALMFVLVGVFAKLTGRVSVWYFVLCILLNVFVLPPLFFMTGGVDSGTIFYCFMGIFVCSLYNHKKRRFLLIVISLCSYEISFLLTRLYPDLVTKVDPEMTSLDYAMSFFFMAVVLYIVVAFLVYVFDKERRQKDALLKRLDFYSKRDPMTGLFNRKHFMNYLDKMIWPERSGFYLLMYDIDDFKQINDKYGHAFGDLILTVVAKNASAERIVGFGECSVRYGGGEFIQLFYAKTFEEALQRAEQLRNKISALSFEDHPEVRITVSGGFVDCTNESFYHPNKMLSVLDKLLNLAKSRGKNQICFRE